MTHTTHHQLDQLRLEWRSLSRSPASRRAAARLIEDEEILRRHLPRDLGEVVSLLEPRGPLSQVERAQVAAALLAATPADPLFARALLQTLLPGIVATARRLGWGRSCGEDPAVFLADLITATYEVITEWAGQQRRYAAPDLLNAARCRMRRRMASVEHARIQPLEHPDGSVLELADAGEGDPFESIEARLLEARSELDPVGVTALYGREVLGLTYRELAQSTGVSTRRLAAGAREVARRISW